MTKSCEIPQILNIKGIHTFFKTNFKNEYIFGGESHIFAEIVFVMDGSVGVIGGEDAYVLEKGQAIIHKPNEFHKIWTEYDSNPEVMIISFETTAFPEFDGRILNVSTSQLRKLEELYEMSLVCFERSGIEITGVRNLPYELQRFKLDLETVLLSVLAKQNENVNSGLRSSEIYSVALRIMEENPGAGYCIDDIADMCSISPAYLKKIFERYAGCGVMKCYNRIRARIACGYLSNGKSVKETSLLLGFADQNYFSVFFKRIMGVSPSRFRGEHN